MRTHQENISYQAEKHPLKLQHEMTSRRQYFEYLLHSYAYEFAADLAEARVVLDFGCNVGYGTNIISRNAKKAVGIDVSTKAIETATQAYKGENLNFHIFDGQRAPFDDGSFELIVSFQVMEHIIDTSSYLSEIKRLLRPGGMVVITTPNASVRLEPGMKPWNKYHVREYTANELKATLTKHFPQNEIKGLFANDIISQTILAHFEKGKVKARKRQRLSYKIKKAVSRRAKIVIPQSDRRGNGDDSKRRNGRLTKDDFARFSTADLYYSDDNPEQSLDLLALSINS